MTFLRRFYIYQKERFPFLAHGLLIAVFTFSAIAYSLACRGVEEFIDLKIYATGVFMTVSFFFLLRIADEFKDKEEDAQYRPYLPVPRGLIQLKELRNVAIIVILIQIAILYFFQSRMWIWYLVVLGYMGLMRIEFFVPEWLKKRQELYNMSHIMIVPLVDLYASGLDWHLAGASPHIGLLFFLGVSYLNGFVLEYGRKIRAPQDEDEGYMTYTAIYGLKKAPGLWLMMLVLTFTVSLFAAMYAHHGMLTYIILVSCFLLCSIPALLFLKNVPPRNAKLIEYAASFWTLMMYLTLGGIPMLLKLIGG